MEHNNANRSIVSLVFEQFQSAEQHDIAHHCVFCHEEEYELECRDVTEYQLSKR